MRFKLDCCSTSILSGSFALMAAALLGLSPSALAQASSTDNDAAPAPASIGADVPLTYFGPTPSQVQRELIGPYQLLKSGQVDVEAGTITLPLYEGRLRDGRTVWYVLTDTDDRGNADALGLNWSAKLTYAAVGRAVRSATLAEDATLVFENGTVDFSPERRVVAGEGSAFPPQVAEPGSIGDNNYSPLVRVANAGNHIYNAPMIAFDTSAEQISACDGNPDHSLVHDKVVSICPEEATVTLKLTPGISFARPILYISFDANDPLAATLEGSTLAPGLGDITVGRDDSAFSAVERLFAFANGPTGSGNPQRQGLDSAIADSASPLNVFGGIPTIATDYSPMWDFNLGVWTQEAIDSGYRSRLTEEFQILGFAQQGWITGPDGQPYGSTGIVVNCPVVFRFL